MTEKVCIPVIESPFIIEKYEETEKCVAEAIQWAKKMEIIGDDYCETMNCVNYIPQVNNLDYEKRLLCAKASIVALVVDDELDSSSSNEVIENLLELSEKAKQALTSDHIPTGETNVEKALLDVVGLLRKYYKTHPKSLSKQVTQSLKYYVRSSQLEMRTKKKKTFALGEYNAGRYFTVGCHTVNAVGLFLCNVELPVFVESNATVCEVFEIANRIIILVNDLASFEKEMNEGLLWNTVCVLKKQRNYKTWQQAIDDVVALIHDNVKAFEMVLKLIPSFGAEIDKKVTEYITFSKILILVACEYSFKSQRYNFRPNFEIPNTV